MDKPPSSQQQQQAGGAEQRSSTPPPASLLRRLRLAAQRLEHYSLRVQKAMATGDRDGLAQALADVAEAHEIARRLSDSLLAFLQYSPPPEP